MSDRFAVVDGLYSHAMEMLEQAIANSNKLVIELERERAEMVGSGEGQATFDGALAVARQLLDSLQQSADEKHDEDKPT